MVVDAVTGEVVSVPSPAHFLVVVERDLPQPSEGDKDNEGLDPYMVPMIDAPNDEDVHWRTDPKQRLVVTIERKDGALIHALTDLQQGVSVKLPYGFIPNDAIEVGGLLVIVRNPNPISPVRDVNCLLEFPDEYILKLLREGEQAREEHLRQLTDTDEPNSDGAATDEEAAVDPPAT